MSLDIYLHHRKAFTCKCGATHFVETGQVDCFNITHNLSKMAEAAGVYMELWRGDEVGIKTANQLVSPLQDGLSRLRSDPEKYMEFNPANGWGDYDTLVRFIQQMLAACVEGPHDLVRYWR
jgi:hypothetical protein